MKRFRICPSRQVRDRIDLPEKLRHDITRIGALAQLIEFCKDARERVFGLGDGKLRVVLALLIKAPMVLDEFFFEECRETVA